jgi:Na+-translocating membrane potential-generating system (MpsC)
MRPDALATAVRNRSQPVHEREADGNGRPEAVQTVPAREPATAPTLEIANSMVRGYKELLGRGPTKTRVLFAAPDTLVVVLEDTMTAQECNLAALGEEARMREHRLFLTTAVED